MDELLFAGHPPCCAHFICYRKFQHPRHGLSIRQYKAERFNHCRSSLLSDKSEQNLQTSFSIFCKYTYEIMKTKTKSTRNSKWVHPYGWTVPTDSNGNFMSKKCPGCGRWYSTDSCRRCGLHSSFDTASPYILSP